jgi:hypothetical protein
MAIGAQFLGGHPETSFHVMLVWAAYALYRGLSIDGWRVHRLAPQLLRIAGMGVLGLALAAVQLLPFAESLAQSSILASRQASALSETSPLIARLLLDWRQWPTSVTALLPEYLGTPLDKSYLYPYSNYVEQNAYAGVLPLGLAIAYAVHAWRDRHLRRNRRALFLIALAILSLGIALRLPLLTVINHLPLFNLANNGRLRLICVFAVSLLAGLGLDAYLADQSQARTLSRVLAVLAALSLLLVLLAAASFLLFREQILTYGQGYIDSQWGTPYYARPLEYYYAEVDARYQKRLQSFSPSNARMYLPVLIPLLFLGMTSGLSRWLGAVRWRAAAAVGLTIVDLFLIGIQFNPAVSPDEVFPVPDGVEVIRRDGELYRVVGTGLTLYPNSGMAVGLHDVRGYDAVLPQRYVDLIDRVDGHYRHGLNSLFVEVDSPLLDLLNVKYALADRPLGGKWELVHEGQGDANVYRNPDALPRIFVVHQAEIVDSPAASLARVTDPSFDFRRSVVLEQAPEDWTSPPPGRSVEATARVTDYGSNEVIVAVSTTATGILVLTDTYAPGWRAYLDDKTVPVYIANHTFRAVVVPPGQHQVRFTYQPTSFSVGLWISVLSAVVALVVAALILIRRQRVGR